jgi:membrane protein
MRKSEPPWQWMALQCRKRTRSFAQMIGNTFQTYGRINGEQCAASFAYYAFFSLFPLILLLVVVGTFFIPDRLQAARQVVRQVEAYVPLQAKDKMVLVETIDHAIQNGWRAGIFGILALIWSALRFFQALVIGVNRAWGFKDYNWWKLPLKNLLMIGILISALVLGLLAPLILKCLKTVFYLDLYLLVGVLPIILPPAILFYGLLMFYKFAPRRSARFSQVWPAALMTTVLLELGQNVFEWYLGHLPASTRSMVFSERSWDCSSGSIFPELFFCWAAVLPRRSMVPQGRECLAIPKANGNSLIKVWQKTTEPGEIAAVSYSRR